MIKIKPNSNQIISKLIFSDGVRAYYLSVCERYSKGYVQTFITDMQILITKIGYIITNIDNNKVSISYCAQSINYLCNTVLDRPSLAKTFSNVGINDKGNTGKHNITTNKIDMNKSVTVYNDLVTSISKKYKLPALLEMIVKKNKDNLNNENSSNHSTPTKKQVIKQNEKQTINNKQEKKKITSEPNEKSIKKVNEKKKQEKKKITSVSNEKQIINNKQVKKKITSEANEKTIKKANEKKMQEKKKITSVPNEIQTTNDERISLTARLARGDGRYTKGILWAKKKMISFLLDVSIDNPDNLKISKVTAIFKCNKNTEIKKLSTLEESTTNINLEATNFSGNIQASVIVSYKIGLFKTKEIKTTVSKNF